MGSAFGDQGARGQVAFVRQPRKWNPRSGERPHVPASPPPSTTSVVPVT